MPGNGRGTSEIRVMSSAATNAAAAAKGTALSLRRADRTERVPGDGPAFTSTNLSLAARKAYLSGLELGAAASIARLGWELQGAQASLVHVALRHE